MWSPSVGSASPSKLSLCVQRFLVFAQPVLVRWNMYTSWVDWQPWIKAFYCGHVERYRQPGGELPLEQTRACPGKVFLRFPKADCILDDPPVSCTKCPQSLATLSIYFGESECFILCKAGPVLWWNVAFLCSWGTDDRNSYQSALCFFAYNEVAIFSSSQPKKPCGNTCLAISNISIKY